jgi:ABC-2 type transport system permease protein
MSPVYTLARKETRAYLVSPIPYVLIVLFTGFASGAFFYLQKFFARGEASMDGFFGILPALLVPLVSGITMRLWSEELRGGTIETLLTMPVRSRSLVLGKFLAAWAMIVVCFVATAPIVITVATLGNLDPGPVWTGYLGATLLGAALLAMGMWISALTRHQIVAFLLTLAAGGVLWLMGVFASDLPTLGPLFEDLSITTRYRALGRGVIDFRDVFYFVSFTVLFLYLNTEAIENRRYR